MTSPSITGRACLYALAASLIGLACGDDDPTGPTSDGFPTIDNAILSDFCVRGTLVPSGNVNSSIDTSDCSTGETLNKLDVPVGLGPNGFFEAWRVRVTSLTTVTFEVSSDFDSFLDLYMLPDLTDATSAVSLDFDDDSGLGFDASLSEMLELNTEYWVFVSGITGSETGSYSLTVLETMGFVFPLLGALNRDFYYVNYVDEQAGAGISDYMCGPKTYDGHRGTDLTLPTFARMDSGVAVIAAAPGTVSFVHDGEFDRNKSREGGGFGNYVVIDHRDGFSSIYGHLAQQSISVSAGQSVTAGTQLGLVGSSGDSDMPHLHIEFLRNGNVVDAFTGPCGPTFTRWATPDAYQDTFMLIASGTSNLNLNLDLLKDPPVQVDTFTAADSLAAMWVELYNVAAGSLSRFELYDPAGALFWSFQFQHDVFYSLSWWFAYHTIPGSMTQTGTWRYDYYNGGDLLARRTFELVPAGTPARAEAARRGERRSGFGGGGLRPGAMSH